MPDRYEDSFGRRKFFRNQKRHFTGKGGGSVGDGLRSLGEAFRQKGRKEERAVDMDDAVRFVAS